MKTRIHIWHNKEGKIIAVGKPATHMTNRVEPQIVNPNHAVISVDIEDDDIKKIHKTYIVDVATSQLKSKVQK